MTVAISDTVSFKLSKTVQYSSELNAFWGGRRTLENIGSASGVFGVMDLTKTAERCVRPLGRGYGRGETWSLERPTFVLEASSFDVSKAALFQAVRLEVLELRHRGMAFA